MATKKAAVNGTDAVNAFLSTLEHPKKAEMEAVRAIIMHANPKIAERIKWNAPSFFYKEDLAAFHPREQKYALLVMLFPKEMIEDGTGMLEGEYKDRRLLKFHDMADVEAKRAALEGVVNAWVEVMERE